MRVCVWSPQFLLSLSTHFPVCDSNCFSNFVASSFVCSTSFATASIFSICVVVYSERASVVTSLMWRCPIDSVSPSSTSLQRVFSTEKFGRVLWIQLCHVTYPNYLYHRRAFVLLVLLQLQKLEKIDRNFSHRSANSWLELSIPRQCHLHKHLSSGCRRTVSELR